MRADRASSHTLTATSEWRLWSTTARLIVTDPAVVDLARETCHGILASIDRAANRFDPSSELRGLPDDGSTVTVSGMLSDLITEALSAAAATSGAVDPTVGSALIDLGYDRDIALVQHAGGLTARIRGVRGWQVVELDGDRLRLPVGVRLDLGATAQAGAADRCARAVVAATGAGALVSLGGDVATAGHGPAGGWQVEVRDLPTERAAQIRLPDGWSVATSSTRRRTWHQGSLERHHLIDPATSRPAESTWAAVSVVARTCLTANTATAATIVKGTAGLDWLARTGLAARILGHDGRVRTLNGWPEQG